MTPQQQNSFSSVEASASGLTVGTVGNADNGMSVDGGVDEEVTGPPLAETPGMSDERWRVRSAAEERSDPLSCLNRAGPLEPVFVLRAEDMTAAATVGFYRLLLELDHATRGGSAPPKHQAVSAIMRAMASWPSRKIPGLGKPFDADTPKVRTASQERLEADSIVNRCERDEPVFVLRAGDPLASRTIQNYIITGINAGFPASRLDAAVHAYKVFEHWAGSRRLEALKPYESPPMETAEAISVPQEKAPGEDKAKAGGAKDVFIGRSRIIGPGDYVCRALHNERVEVLILPHGEDMQAGGNARLDGLRSFVDDPARLRHVGIRPGALLRFDAIGLEAIFAPAAEGGAETWRRPQPPHPPALSFGEDKVLSTEEPTEEKSSGVKAME